MLMRDLIAHVVIIIGAETEVETSPVSAEVVALIAAGIDPTIIGTDLWLSTMKGVCR